MLRRGGGYEEASEASPAAAAKQTDQIDVGSAKGGRQGGRKTEQSSPFLASWGLVEAVLGMLSSSLQSTSR